LKHLTLSYKNKIFSGQTLAKYGFLPIGKGMHLWPSDMAGMFAGLWFNRRIIGFGIISRISSLSRICIQTRVTNFSKIHLSNIGLNKDKTSEFRIL